MTAWSSSDCRMSKLPKLPRPVPNAPLNDYRDAVARAIAWPGNRYLLANPVNVTARVDTLARRFGRVAREEC